MVARHLASDQGVAGSDPPTQRHLHFYIDIYFNHTACIGSQLSQRLLFGQEKGLRSIFYSFYYIQNWREQKFTDR